MGAGSGQVARCAVESQADLLLGLSAGPYRHHGSGSLVSIMPYGNANLRTRALITRATLPQAYGEPVVASVCGHDPTIDLDALLKEFVDLGVAGVTNWPALGVVDGAFRAALEQEGVTEDTELAMLSKARALGLSTIGFVLVGESARRFAEVGCDALIFGLKLTLTRQWADAHEHRNQLRQAITRFNGMTEAVRASGRNPLLLTFGGPVVNADDFAEVLRYRFVHGFAAGSVFERLPVQDVVAGTSARVTSVAVDHAGAEAGDGHDGLFEMAGRSPAMKRLFALIARVAPRILHRSAKHPWPSNVRELQHTVMRCVLMKDGAVIAGHAFSAATKAPPTAGQRDPERLRQQAERAVQTADGNKSQAATALGITRKTLYGWLRDGG